jgi:uncharacterized Ntn-hydrolase superfamily protein
MTYSIVARDDRTGEIGVAVQTHQMCVGVGVPWVEADVGAIATQALTNVSFGPVGLTMLRHGVDADRVIKALVASDEGASRRQVAAIDARGQAAAWTGTDCIPEAGHRIGPGYSVQANMMVRSTVPDAMAAAYEGAGGNLVERLWAALSAAQKEGGDIRGMQSAAILIRGGSTARVLGLSPTRALYDLRVDEHSHPLAELERLIRLRRADILSRHGDKALEGGDTNTALARWEEARQLAPELEEVAYWQALALADDGGDVEGGAKLLAAMLEGDPRRDEWIELVRRLGEGGYIEREGVADSLLAALEGSFGS